MKWTIKATFPRHWSCLKRRNLQGISFLLSHTHSVWAQQTFWSIRPRLWGYDGLTVTSMCPIAKSLQVQRASSCNPSFLALVIPEWSLYIRLSNTKKMLLPVNSYDCKLLLLKGKQLKRGWVYFGAQFQEMQSTSTGEGRWWGYEAGSHTEVTVRNHGAMAAGDHLICSFVCGPAQLTGHHCLYLAWILSTWQ